MCIFREGKSSEEELKAWNFWHSRQHSVKQRILDADTKNSIGKFIIRDFNLVYSKKKDVVQTLIVRFTTLQSMMNAKLSKQRF